MKRKEPLRSILVFDNKRTLSDALYSFFLKKGFKTALVFDRRSVIDCIKSNCLDVIFTDFNLSGLDGYHLLELVKNVHREYKVILISPDGAKRKYFLQKGALEVFDTPANLDKFLENLISLMQDRRRSKRFKIKGRVSCSLNDPEKRKSFAGELVNISLDGALIKLKEKPSLKNAVIEFCLSPKLKIICRASSSLVRSTKKGNFHFAAFYFDDRRDIDLLKPLIPYLSAGKS